jgi:RNA polymerase sigma-70 factor (family 1)
LQELNTYYEPALLKQVAEGSANAFQQIFDNYRRRCFTYSYKLTGSREAAEDILQDVFLKVWTRRETLPEIENFSAYLYRMVHNQSYRVLERIAREGLVLHLLTLQPENQSPNFADTPERQLLSAEIRQHIQNLVDQLTPRQREIFLLNREHGLKYDEIAKKLGIGFETVKYHLAEALKILRAGLTDQYGTEAMVIFIIWQLGIF